LAYLDVIMRSSKDVLSTQLGNTKLVAMMEAHTYNNFSSVC
jgi:hypothetical protein